MNYLKKLLSVVNAQHVVKLVPLTNLLGFSQGSQICTVDKVPGNKICIVFDNVAYLEIGLPSLFKKCPGWSLSRYSTVNRWASSCFLP